MKNYWSVALVISILFHVALVTKYSPFFSAKNKTEQEKNVTKKEKSKEIKIIPEKIQKIKSQIPEETVEAKPLPYVENIMSRLVESDNFSPMQKPQIFEKNIKEIIFSELPQPNKELKKNPAYTNYYRLVREKIRSNAYNNYNTKAHGQVVIEFLISNNGDLKEVELGSASISNKVLRAVALKSVKQAAPFPAFPAELNQYSQLRFNISIEFKSN